MLAVLFCFVFIFDTSSRVGQFLSFVFYFDTRVGCCVVFCFGVGFGCFVLFRFFISIAVLAAMCCVGVGCC